MFSWLKRKFHKEPERSLKLRLVVFAAMMVPLLARVRVRSDLLPHAFLAALGIAGGHWFSYRTLEKGGRLVKILMFVAIHLALCWMLVGLGTGATVPQAQFAIFAQAITSFDLRTRSNLFNTLIHSLANLYVAATLSRTTELGLYLILFTALALVAFYVAEKESGLRRAKLIPKTGRPTDPLPLPRPSRRLTLFGLSFGAILLLAVIVVFLFTPRYSNRPIVPPFSLNLPLSGGTSAEIINPGVPLVQVNGWSNGTSDYYYGFDTNLDLRYRGGLSDAVVMYVRSPSRSYWRSHSYDYYDGVTWRQSDQTLTRLENRGVYYELPVPLGGPQSQRRLGRPGLEGERFLQDRAGRPRHFEELFQAEAGDPPPEQRWRQNQQIVQTFNIVRDQPNLIFAAYRPAEIFISTEKVSLDGGDGIRLPQPLQAGMTYSVVSYRPDFDPARLRQINTTNYPADVARRYLQLPANISQRVKHLAGRLAGPQANTFDKVMAINNHLLTEYPYNFFPPPHPPGAEVVDTFLFVDQEGVCEQYVTALVVMARSLGIPARLAAGYGAGDYNPVTGYYEVRYSHAHAWAEIYFPEVGWVPFDPTPGWTPQPYPTPAQNWLFANNGQLLRQLTGLDLPMGAIASGGLAGLTFFTPFLIGSTLLVGLALLLWYGFERLLRLWAAWQAVDRYSMAAGGDKNRQAILRRYRQGAQLLARRNYDRRRPWETVAEYANRIDSLPALTRLSRLAELAAYDPETPGPAAVEQAQASLTKLRLELKEADSDREGRPPA